MKKVAIELHSGLGNQIFMIFNLLSYYIDYCDDFLIYYNTSRMPKYYWDNMFLELKDKISNKCDIANIYEEIEFNYKKIPEYENDILLKGFFQSDKYFKHNINKIKKYLNIDDKISTIRNEYPEYFNRKTISLHFRIGDYYFLQERHPIKTLSYYLKSFKKLQDNNINLSEYNILVFCQECDNNIANEYLKHINNNFPNLNYKKVADNIPDWKQLLLMCSCDNYIIANSTFSWLGAYLSVNKEAVKIAPEKWFGEYYNDKKTHDLIPPEDWILIND